MGTFSFPKKYKLKSNKAIAAIFKQKVSVGAYPLRVFYLKTESIENEPCLKVAFSVSKKYFKRAVDRNRVKRLMREAFRMDKNRLEMNLMEKNIAISAMLVYVSPEICNFKEMQKAVKKSIDRFLNQIEN
jgi:ribonuclease P protein component